MRTNKRKGHSLLALFMVILMAFQLLPSTMVFAAETGSEAPVPNSFNVEFVDEGVVITGYKYKDNSVYTSVTIPAKIGGNKVVGIGPEAFKDSYYLQQVKIPDTVTYIGDSAFMQSAIREVTIPGSVANVDMFAFKSCKFLERVYILYGVQSIGDGAFSDCPKLSTVAIAPSTTEIKDKVFAQSEKTQVQANPDSTAGKYTGFEGKVSSEELPADSPAAYEYTVDEKTGEIIIEGYVGTSKVPVIPGQINGGTVTEIGDGAFEDKPITQVTLPPSLKTIGANAFAGTNLTVVEIPSTVTGIGDGAFNDDSRITLKGDSEGLDEYLKKSKFVKFEPYGPGRTKYHEMVVTQKPSLAGVIIQGRTQEYKQDTVITIEAKPKTPASGGSADKGTYRFIGWTVESKNGNVVDENGPDITSLIAAPNLSKTTIIMPSYDIILTANYELIPPEPLIIRDGVVLLYTGYPNTPRLVIQPTWEYKDDVLDETTKTCTVHTIGSMNKNNGRPFIDPLMEGVFLPPTITTILPTAFMEASGLKKIEVATDNPDFQAVDGVLYNKDMTKLLAYPANKEGEEFTVPASVKEIGDYAFYQNRHLKKVVIGDTVTRIGSYAFSSLSQLKEVNIPSSISYLGSYAFYGCSRLDTVVWGDNSQIKTIPAFAFGQCAFMEVNLPNGATGIADYAFAYNYNLKVINVSKTITNLASNAFFGCKNIIEINVQEGNPKYASEDGVLFNSDKTVLMTYPIAKVELYDAYTVPESVKTIDSGAFGHAQFSTINLSNVTAIGSTAFAGSNIKAIDLSKVTSIGQQAFDSCTKLTEIAWPAAVTVVPSYVFQNCSALTKVTLPDTVTSIGNQAFYKCANLEEAAFPSTLTSIGKYAFYNCGKLKEANFPEKLTKIDQNAFELCRSLKTITVPNIGTFGTEAFKNCTGLESITVNAARIPDYAFYGASNAQSLTLASGVKNIGSYAFYGCSKLPSVTIPASTIGTCAFGSNTALSELTLQDTVQSIGSQAFVNCNQLETVNIPASVTNIGLRAFNSCDGLKSITVSEGNTSYASDEGGVLYNKDYTNLICYPQAKEGESFTTQESVTTVSDFAFEGSNNLTALTLSDKVTSIGYSLLSSASKINKITIYNKDATFRRNTSYSAQSIFYGIPDSMLQQLVVYGYLGSTAENEVFANRIKGIKFMALDGATEGLIIKKVPKNLRQRTVDNMPLNANTWLGEVVGYQVPIDAMKTDEAKNVIVPSLVTNETKGIIVQDENGDIITLADGESIITSVIGEHAFWYPGVHSLDTNIPEHVFTKAITTITLPQTITELKDSAFAGCSALHTFSIPSSVQKIHPYAFLDCSALTEIMIPKNVAMLGETTLYDEESKTEVYKSAFYGCTNLQKIDVEAGNKQYASVDGVLMNAGKNKIYEAPNGFTGNVSSESGHYVIPEGVTAVGSSAFVGCTLRQVDFPSTVKHVGVGAFQGVFTLPNSMITFPTNSIAEVDLDNEAFKDCTGLTTVKLPPELIRMGDGLFNGCTALTSFEIPASSTDYRTIDGVLFAHTVTGDGVESYALVMYPLGKAGEIYTIPADIPVREIYDGAFQNNKNLKQIVLSDDVQDIDNSAFRNCSNLAEVVWGASVQHIKGSAFEGTALTTISLPDTANQIDARAFANCALTRAEIYARDAVLGESVFTGYDPAFVLCGFENSTVQDYATANGLTFEILTDGGSKQYDITIDSTITNGTVTADKKTAVYQEVVTLTVTPAEGYQLVEGSLKMNGTALGSGITSFTMPKENAVVTAEFELIPVVPEAADAPKTQSVDQADGDTTGETPTPTEPESDKAEPADNF